MKRRLFLSTITALSGAALSGCTGGSTDSTGSSETTTSATTAAETAAASTTSAASYVDAAATQLGEAATALTDEREKLGQTGDVEFETSPIVDHLDEADAALSKADEVASGDQQATVTTLQRTSRWVRATTTALDRYDETMSRISTAQARFDDNEFGDAVDALDRADESLTTCRKKLTVAADQLDEVDTAAVHEFDAIDFAAVKDTFDRLRTVSETMTYFISGYADMCRGFEDFISAAKAYDAERFETAETKFGAAGDHFATSHGEFSRGESAAESDLRDSLSQLTCLAGAFRDGSDHYEAAATAAKNGNTEKAKTEKQRGEETVDRCDSSSDSS